MLGSAREVNRPREGIVRVLTIRQALGSPFVMLRTALLGGTINLEVVGLMHLRETVSGIPVGIPGTIPPGRAARPGIDVDGVRAGMVALLVVVEADAHWTIAAAGPGVEDAPSAVRAYVLASLGRIGRGRFARLTGWLSRRLGRWLS